ncbi:MAG: transporter substrate-binding domain-containing protein [Paracoccus sp. (in: a-proteobacteria)]|uniref:transporter substrate-binding domain-containing protein n=1 Tax=Paracoccus sp. TaxID=267 RepID=UPI00391A05FD
MRHVRLIAPLIGLLAAGSASAETPLKSALDGNAPPFAMPRMDGSVEGLSVDLTAEIATRLGRDISLEAMAFAALIPALQAGTFDFLSVPFSVTEERSQAFLLTEGIWSADRAFLIPADGAQLASFEDLRGKTIATNKGNVDDLWAREQADEYGWTVEAYGSLNDAAQAVQSGRADASVVNVITALSIAGRNPAVRVSDLRDVTGAFFTYAIPLGSEDLRQEIEGAIECIKADGTAAELYEKWLGEAPAEGSLNVTPQPGWGPEGYGNFDPTEHPLDCD